MSDKSPIGIRRNKRNLGKSVRVNQPDSEWHGRQGVIKGFRGDWGKRNDGVVIPFVQVYISGMVWTFRGDFLERV